MTAPSLLTPPRLEEAAHLILRVGRLLLGSGADTGHALRRIETMAAALGVEADVFISSERLLLTVRAGAAFRTKLGHPLTGAGISMSRLGRLDAVVDRLVAGSIDLGEAERRLDAVEAAPPLYPGWLVVAAVGATTACLARLFGADWPVVAAAFLAGIASTGLRRLLARRGANPFGAAFLTAFASGLLGALALKAVPGAVATPCLAAAGMILVPGVPLINGISDVAGGHIEIGMARLASGTITILAIGFGLFLAAALAGDALPVSSGAGAVPVVQDVLVSGLAAFGYALLFDVPLRAVWACILCGMAGHGLRTALGAAGIEIATGTLVCATLVGLLAHRFGAHRRLPPVTFAFPGVVAMIPGSYALRAAIGSLQLMALGPASPGALVAETLSLAIAAMVMTAAVGTGLVLAAALQHVRPVR